MEQLRDIVRLETDRGVVVGRLVSRGESPAVYLPASGSVVDVDPARLLPSEPGDEVSFLHQEELGRRLREVDERLSADPAARLVDGLLSIARGRGYQHSAAGGLHKVPALSGPRALYISRSGRSVHLAGFCLEHPLIQPISEERARELRLGRVRGWAVDVPPSEALGLWLRCLDRLG